MDTMTAIWWTGPEKLEVVHNAPIPEIQPGTVKIKLAYAALCATDMHMVSMGVMNAGCRKTAFARWGMRAAAKS